MGHFLVVGFLFRKKKFICGDIWKLLGLNQKKQKHELCCISRICDDVRLAGFNGSHVHICTNMRSIKSCKYLHVCICTYVVLEIEPTVLNMLSKLLNQLNYISRTFWNRVFLRLALNLLLSCLSLPYAGWDYRYAPLCLDLTCLSS